MSDDLWQRLDADFAEFSICRAPEGANDAEIDAAEQELGMTFHPDYREFLRRYGSGSVGAYNVYGVRPNAFMSGDWSVVKVTKEYRRLGYEGADEWYIISVENADPIGIDAAGRVWINTPQFGGVQLEHENFEEFIRKCLDEQDRGDQ